MSVDAYMKIEGIDGESTDAAHEKWIQLLSIEHGVMQLSDSPSAEKARPQFDSLVVTKSMDASSPSLTLYCCNATLIPTVHMELCLPTGEKHVFMTLKLTEAFVKSVSFNHSAGSEAVRPVEVVTFNYSKISWDYTSIDDKGKTGATIARTWNLKTNKQE